MCLTQDTYGTTLCKVTCNFIRRNKLLIKFHKSLISSYILLTLVHTLSVIFIRRNKLLLEESKVL